MDTVGESITNRQTKVLQLKVATTDGRFERFVIRKNTNMYYIANSISGYTGRLI
jgi:hypothetical protein